VTGTPIGAPRVDPERSAGVALQQDLAADIGGQQVERADAAWVSQRPAHDVGAGEGGLKLVVDGDPRAGSALPMGEVAMRAVLSVEAEPRHDHVAHAVDRREREEREVPRRRG
jgi:hypothetical protein